MVEVLLKLKTTNLSCSEALNNTVPLEREKENHFTALNRVA